MRGRRKGDERRGTRISDVSNQNERQDVPVKIPKTASKRLDTDPALRHRMTMKENEKDVGKDKDKEDDMEDRRDEKENEK